MAAHVLTQAQANMLYAKGLAILEGLYNLTTRTASYDWNPTAQHYEQVIAGLRVQHCAGTRWNGQRFVECWCSHCERLPMEQRAEVVGA